MSKKSSRYLKFLNNSSKNTNKSYLQSIRKYESFHQMTIDELIEEALDEQTNQVPPHLLKIIDRIEEFQEELIEQGLVVGTIKNHITKIKSIYHKNRVHIPFIEPLNPKRCKHREYIEFKDILTKKEIIKCLPYLRLPSQARAMVIAQGGLSNEECEHLTTRNFLDELKQYHQCDDDVEALEWLSNENNPVIWITRLVRVKTGKPYYAIIGEEAVNKIAEAILYELGLPKNNGVLPDKLLNGHKKAFAKACASANQKVGLGLVAEESKFRSHMLRKFHATNIGGGVLNYEEQSIISNAEIDEMQGRGKTNVQDTYIKTNPLRQKVLYAKVMNNVSFWHEYDYVIKDNDVEVFIVDPSDENRKLKKEVERLSSQLQQKKEASEKVNALRKELGDDVFKDMIGEILNAN